MALVKIRKVRDEIAIPFGFKSWMELWEFYKGSKTNDCEVLHCEGEAETIDVVQKMDGNGEYYLIPLCLKCSEKAEKNYLWVLDLDLLSLGRELTSSI